METRNIVNMHIVRDKHLSKKGNREAEKADEYVKELRKDMDARLSELKVQMDDLQQRAAQKVTEQPVLALAVAFVAGMALGVALSRSGD